MKDCSTSAFVKLVALCICLIMLFGCSGAKNPDVLPSEGEQPTENGVTDMEEYDCLILQCSLTDGTGTFISEANPFGYEGTSTFAEAVKKRISDIEKKTKAVITMETTDADGAALSASFAVGDNIGDIFYSASNKQAYIMANAGGFADIAGFESIDLRQTDKYGDANVLEANTSKGLTYIVTPVKWPLKQPRVVSLFMFDNKLLKSLNLDDMRLHLEAGTWTWDALEGMLSQYTVNEGETSYAAVVTRLTDFGRLAVFGNGVKQLHRDESGNPITDLDSPALLEAFQWVRDVVNEQPNAISYNYADWVNVIDGFNNRDGVCALIPTTMVYTEFSYSVDDFFLMPFPTGPSGKYGEWPGYIEGAEGFAVLDGGDDADYAAEIISMLCEPFEGYETEADLVDYLASNVLFNEADAELILNLYKNSHYTYWAQSGSFFLTGYLSNATVMKRQTPSEYVASKIDEQWAFMNEYMVPNLTVYDRVGE